MKIPKPAPVTSGVDEAAHQVTLRTAELAALRAEIAAAEAALPALAQSDDDEAFESASLAIERLRRAELRAVTRLEQARVAHAEAEAREEQDRRKALYEAGVRATAEAEKLAGSYAEHAAAIAAILRKIDLLRPQVEAGNGNLPEGEDRINTHAFGIYHSVELPAVTKDGERFWWKPDYYGYDPLNPPPAPKFVPQVLTDLVPSPSEKPVNQRQTENGTRRYVMPPCDFGRPAQ